MPVLISTGFIRLVSHPAVATELCSLATSSRQRVIVLKDQTNKRAHAESAQIACEAAGGIRTVASLTREGDCCKIYSESLEEPLQRSNKSAIWSNMLYAISQAVTCVLAFRHFLAR